MFPDNATRAAGKWDQEGKDMRFNCDSTQIPKTCKFSRKVLKPILEFPSKENRIWKTAMFSSVSYWLMAASRKIQIPGHFLDFCKACIACPISIGKTRGEKRLRQYKGM